MKDNSLATFAANHLHGQRKQHNFAKDFGKIQSVAFVISHFAFRVPNLLFTGRLIFVRRIVEKVEILPNRKGGGFQAAVTGRFDCTDREPRMRISLKA